MMEQFTWGDTVRVRSDAPEENRPGSMGSVCGLPDPRRDDDDQYLVEFSDGHSIQIHGPMLEAV